MIKINLLPQELRKKKKSVPRIPYILLVILGAVLFLLLTFFFYCDSLWARSAHKSVSNEWLKMSPSLVQLKALETKVEVQMKGEKEFLEKNVLNTQSMTLILTWASEFPPPKCWLTEFKAEREGEGCRLTLEGVVLPSRTQTSIEQIEEYFRKLKMKLPPQTSVAVITSKGVKDIPEGTAFVAHLDWGVEQKS